MSLAEYPDNVVVVSPERIAEHASHHDEAHHARTRSVGGGVLSSVRTLESARHITGPFDDYVVTPLDSAQSVLREKIDAFLDKQTPEGLARILMLIKDEGLPNA